MTTRPTVPEVLAAMTPDQRERAKKRLLEGTEIPPMVVTFFFPEKMELRAISVPNISVPLKGQRIYIRHDMIMDIDAERNYEKYTSLWRVKDVYFSMRVPANLKDSLLWDIHYHVEVFLKPAVTWFRICQKVGWHKLMRKIGFYRFRGWLRDKLHGV